MFLGAAAGRHSGHGISTPDGVGGARGRAPDAGREIPVDASTGGRRCADHGESAGRHGVPGRAARSPPRPDRRRLPHHPARLPPDRHDRLGRSRRRRSRRGRRNPSATRRTRRRQGPGPKKIATRLLPGESLAFHYPDEEDRALAVRLDDGTLVGYSAICTHLARAVLWRKDRGSEGELYCPCREGVFDARTGEVTAGPPPRALPKVVLTEQTDGGIRAVGTTRSGESIEHGLCRRLSADRPDLASRIGCPAVRGGGAEAPLSGASWMEGNTGTAWWGSGFLCLSFLVVLGLWLLDPRDC
ncbi:ubiquinol-cytochrome c reductase iron-sulfur subunit [Streptomyces sp. NPDC088846]|uniref:QcrA and Rieske domain-containing protein n=1 Tax=Streptomyces sp. NPDC088846 TaxID=3365908 RepID=UPI00382E4444